MDGVIMFLKSSYRLGDGARDKLTAAIKISGLTGYTPLFSGWLPSLTFLHLSLGVTSLGT
ncbi:hypothetical protein DPMN_005097 [Dreissena polymorpha]|uniref:Uncharacterized protein n=1 Tax=Dreissena polymorpha TaxID=45954 RepID=A0A9D4RU40_DREPO|nr:hypothetical protein DPMN_005097 [Dreissena polymorpha]